MQAEIEKNININKKGKGTTRCRCIPLLNINTMTRLSHKQNTTLLRWSPNNSKLLLKKTDLFIYGQDHEQTTELKHNPQNPFSVILLIQLAE